MHPFLLFAILFFSPWLQDFPLTINGKPAKSHYELSVPTSWEIQRNTMGCDMIALTPLESNDDTFRENITVTIENTDKMEMDEYVRLSKNSLEKLEGFKLVRQWDGNLNGKPCKRLEYKATMQDLKLHNDLIVIMHKGSAFNFTMGMLEGGSREQNFKRLLVVAESVHFSE